MTMREKMARAMCIRQGYDPDKRAIGLGYIMPHRVRYRLWEAQLPQVDAALDQLMEPTFAMLDGFQDGDTPMDTDAAREFFQSMIRAIGSEI